MINKEGNVKFVNKDFLLINKECVIKKKEQNFYI